MWSYTHRGFSKNNNILPESKFGLLPLYESTFLKNNIKHQHMPNDPYAYYSIIYLSGFQYFEATFCWA